MPSIVFINKKWTMHDKAPLPHEVPKNALMCVVGRRKQRWFCRYDRNWRPIQGYLIAPKHIRLLKMIMLSINQPLPTNSSITDEYYFWGKP